MDVEQQRVFGVAFVIDEESLKRLDGIISQTNQVARCKLVTIDDLTFNYNNINDLLRNAVSSYARFNGMEIYSPRNTRPSIKIALGSSDDTTVRYTISGSETEVRLLDARLTEWTRTIATWHSFISRWKIRKPSTVLLILLVPFVAAYAMFSAKLV